MVNNNTPNNKKGQRGNVFFTLFGAVAVVGVLGAGIMSTMRGPLSTMVEVNRRTQAEAEMQIVSKVALLEATEGADSGDCDADGFVEPVPFDSAGTSDAPTGGGFLPSSIGGAKIDPWGTDYGYCVWDAGTQTDAGSCSGENRLSGDGSASTTYPVVVVISAGANKKFETTCSGGANPGVSKTSGSDDFFEVYDYAAAAANTGGLWNIKQGDPSIAEIGKDLEVTGTGTSSFAGLLAAAAGLELPERDDVDCNSANVGILARNKANTTGDYYDLAFCTNDGSGDYDYDIIAGPSSGATWEYVGSVIGSGAFYDNFVVINGDTQESSYALTVEDNGGNSGLWVNGNSEILGDVTLGSGITDTVTIPGIVTIGDTLGVTGNTTLTGTLDVTGLGTFEDLTVNGTLSLDDLTIPGNLTVETDTDLQGNVADSTGNLTLADDVDITGALDVTGAVDVTGATTLSNTLDVTGTLSADGDVNIGDSNTDTLIVESDATFNDDLTVAGTSTLAVQTEAGIGGSDTILIQLSGSDVVREIEIDDLVADTDFGGELSGLNADMVDNYHEHQLLKSHEPDSLDNGATLSLINGSSISATSGTNVSIQGGADLEVDGDINVNMGGSINVIGNSATPNDGFLNLDAPGLGGDPIDRVLIIDSATDTVREATAGELDAWIATASGNEYLRRNADDTFGTPDPFTAGPHSFVLTIGDGLGTDELQIASGAIFNPLVGSIFDLDTTIDVTGLENIMADVGSASFLTREGAGNLMFGTTARPSMVLVSAEGPGDEYIDSAAYNTFLGENVAPGITEGDFNTVTGYGAMQTNTLGSRNVLNGYQAGYYWGQNDVANIGNVLLGYQAGYDGLATPADISGSGNVYIGESAGSTHTAGDNNILIGNGVEKVDWTGAPDATTISERINIGNAIYGELGDTTNAQGNDARITIDGDLNVSGSIIGSVTSVDLPIDVDAATAPAGVVMDINAGGSNFLAYTGTNNLFVGEGAGDAITAGGTGVNNTAIGRSAGTAITDGDNNVFVGNASGTANNSGYSNTFLGSMAGQANTSGNSNIFIGTQAGAANTTQGESTMVGTSAGQVSTGGDNTFFGYRSGFANTSGSENTFLGRAAGDNVTTGSGNIVIGTDIDTNAATSTNYLNIGGGLYGDMGGTGFDTDDADLVVDGVLTVNTDLNVDGTIYGTIDSAIFELNGTTVRTIDSNAPWATSDFVVGSGTLDGTGTRMFFDKGTGAFRVGETTGTQWNNATLGSHSFAGGLDTEATNLYGFAFGNGANAYADYAVAFGSGQANVDYGFAAGNATEANGVASFAAGASSQANADYATAFGQGTQANDSHAFAAGLNTQANGATSVAFGNSTQASGVGSGAFGLNSQANGDYAFAAGNDAQANTNGAAAFGTATRSNGNNSLVFGNTAEANGDNSFAGGDNVTQANSTGAFAIGNGVQANGDYSAALGTGTQANDTNAFAGGNTSVADGVNAFAFGDNAAAQTYNEISLGYYPVVNAGNATSAVSTDVLFELGNGTSGTPSNAVTILKNGNATFHNDLTVSGTLYASISGAISWPQNINGFEQLLMDGTDDYLTRTGAGNLFLGQADRSELDPTSGNGENNTIIGEDSGRNITTGNRNVALGTRTLGATSTGNANTAIGYEVLLNNTTSYGNTAVGFLSMHSNTTANNNSAFGRQSMQYNTSGEQNSAFGYMSLNSNTIGQENTAMGQSAMQQNTSGTENSAFGLGALRQNTTGIRNTALGHGALILSTTGSNNVGIGFGAGRDWGNNGVANENNVLIGLSAGYDNTLSDVSGTDNVYIGRQAGSTHTSGDSSILIGAGVQKIDSSAAAQVAGSEYLNIGNALYGSLGDTTDPVDGGADLFLDGSLHVVDTLRVDGTLDINGVMQIDSTGGSISFPGEIVNNSTTATIDSDGDTNFDVYLNDDVTIAEDLNVLGTITGTYAGSIFEFVSATDTVRTIDANAPYASADFVFGSPTLDYSTEASRMFFDKDLSAFRAGYAQNTNWDTAQIGQFSAAFGNITEASGDYSFAAGYNTLAGGNHSVSFGYNASATGNNSIVMGSYTQAWGADAIAFGSTASAQASSSLAISAGSYAQAMSGANTSVAIGDQVRTYGFGSYALGNEVYSYGAYSTIWGLSDQSATAPRVTGDNSFAIMTLDQDAYDMTEDNTFALIGAKIMIDGDGNATTGEGCIRFNDATDVLEFSHDCTTYDTIAGGANSLWENNAGVIRTVDANAPWATGDFVFGSSQLNDVAAQAWDNNRMLFDKDLGAFRVGTIASDGWDASNLGQNSFAAGQSVRATGNESFAGGSASLASGERSVALGQQSVASGNRSVSLGYASIASNDRAVAMGDQTTASGSGSTAMGSMTLASGNESTAMGLATAANSLIETSIGRYSTTGGTPGTWVATDTLFEIGNGTADGTRNNAVTVLKNGNTTIDGDLTLTASSFSGGAGVLALDNDADGTARGCLRFNGTVLEFANDCTNYDPLAGTSGGASVGLNDIIAATTGNTIANANNAQVWNWALDGDVTGMAFGESTASVNGTGSQYVLSAGTLATSTATPLYVENAGAANSFVVADEATDTTPFVIDAAGNVGIGTATPGSGSAVDTKLDIVGSGSGTGGRTNVRIQNTTANSAASISLVNSSGHYFALQANGADYSTGPSGNFAVNGFDMSFYTNGETASGGSNDIYFYTGGYLTDPVMTLLDNNLVGINRDDPTEQLSVAGVISVDNDSADADRGCLRFNGTNLQFSTDTTCTAWDDVAGASSAGVFEVTGGAGSEVVNARNGLAPHATADFVFGSTQLDDTGNADQDSRMFFDKSKGAFRAGYVTAGQWNDINIGFGSTAMGQNTTASGGSSTAMGQNTTASGAGSTAMGFGATASGTSSTAMGSDTNASSQFSTAMGHDTTASGDNSTAMGFGTTASGASSTAMGDGTTASGAGSTAMGIGTTAETFAEISIGRYPLSNPGNPTTWSAGDVLFEIGNGISGAGRSNALTILKNGNTTIDGDLTVTGSVNIAGGGGGLFALNSATNVVYNTGDVATEDFVFGSTQLDDDGGITDDDNRMFFDKAKGAFRAGRADSDAWDDAKVGIRSAAFGWRTEASGTTSTAFGRNSIADGINSIAMGSNSDALGDTSFAAGSSTIASGDFSTTFGVTSTASGTVSFAAGMDSAASSYAEISLGHYPDNTTGDNTDWATSSGLDDILFEIGNGTSGARNNAFQITKQGNATIDGDLLVTGVYRNTSDERLKANIEDLASDATQSLIKLRTVSYNWNELSGKDTDEKQLGLIAQDVQKSFPELVGSFIEKGQEYLSVNYTGLIAPIINAIKELFDIVAELRAENEALRSEVDSLKADIEAIKAQLSVSDADNNAEAAE